MPNTIHDNSRTFDLEQHTIVTNSQAVLWSVVRQTLHITSQIGLQDLDLRQNPPARWQRQVLQILDCSRLESNFAGHSITTDRPRLSGRGLF
jgi:hypothetical protein